MSKNRSENASFLLEDEVEPNEFHDPISVETEPLILNIMEMHFSVGQIFWTMSSAEKKLRYLNQVTGFKKVI